MALVSTATLLQPAYARGRGVGVVDVVTLEQAEGTVLGAEQAGLPVILQVGQQTSRFHLGDPTAFGAALSVLARTSLVEVALHLDHVSGTGLLQRAAAAGFSSVLLAADERDVDLPSYAQHVETTAAAVRLGHEQGLLVGAELGHVAPDGELDSPHRSGVRTDPGQAAAFVAATGADALAAAVGGSAGDARIDLDLVRRLAAALDVPLLLHDASAVDQPELTDAVTAGMTAVAFAAVSSVAMTRVVRRHLHDLPDVHDPTQYLGPARQAVSTVVAELIATVGLAPHHVRGRSGTVTVPDLPL